MKVIELTKEQEDKLLEMAKTLFPKYNNLRNGDSSFSLGYCSAGEMNGFLEYATNEPIDKTIDDGWRSIHWFEFCVKKVVNELAWMNIKTDILADCEYEDARMRMINELFKDRPTPGIPHPVEYLYEEFKKLK